MALTKQNVCVFIENKAQLNEAKKLIKKYNGNIDETVFFLSNKHEDFLQYFQAHENWGLAYQSDETQITISELEAILKNESK